MTNEEFANKYANQWITYYNSKQSFRCKIAGYIGCNEIIVERAFRGQLGPGGFSRVHLEQHGGIFVSQLPSIYPVYHRVPQGWFENDDEITKPHNILPQKKLDMNHYPHTCLKCGKPSYNAMYGGRNDCSAKCS